MLLVAHLVMDSHDNIETGSSKVNKRVPAKAQ